MILGCHYSCADCDSAFTGTGAPMAAKDSSSGGCTACDVAANRLDLSMSCYYCPCKPGYYDDGVHAACASNILIMKI